MSSGPINNASSSKEKNLSTMAPASNKAATEVKSSDDKLRQRGRNLLGIPLPSGLANMIKPQSGYHKVVNGKRVESPSESSKSTTSQVIDNRSRTPSATSTMATKPSTTTVEAPSRPAKRQFVNKTSGLSSSPKPTRIAKPSPPKYNSIEAKAKLNERATKRPAPAEDLEEDPRASPKRVKMTTDDERIAPRMVNPKSRKNSAQPPKKEEEKKSIDVPRSTTAQLPKRDDIKSTNSPQKTAAQVPQIIENKVAENVSSKEAPASKTSGPKYPGLSSLKVRKRPAAVPAPSGSSKSSSKDDTRPRNRSPSPHSAGRTDHYSPPQLNRKRQAHFDDGEPRESKRVKESGMWYVGAAQSKGTSGDNVHPAFKRVLKSYEDIDMEMGEAPPIAQAAEAEEKSTGTEPAEPKKTTAVKSAEPKKGVFDDSDEEEEDTGVELFPMHSQPTDMVVTKKSGGSETVSRAERWTKESREALKAQPHVARAKPKAEGTKKRPTKNEVVASKPKAPAKAAKTPTASSSLTKSTESSLNKKGTSSATATVAKKPAASAMSTAPKKAVKSAERFVDDSDIKAPSKKAAKPSVPATTVGKIVPKPAASQTSKPAKKQVQIPSGTASSETAELSTPMTESLLATLTPAQIAKLISGWGSDKKKELVKFVKEPCMLLPAGVDTAFVDQLEGAMVQTQHKMKEDNSDMEASKAVEEAEPTKAPEEGIDDLFGDDTPEDGLEAELDMAFERDAPETLPKSQAAGGSIDDLFEDPEEDLEDGMGSSAPGLQFKDPESSDESEEE